MKKNKTTWSTIATACCYAAGRIGWHLYVPRELTLQNPGADNRPAGLARKADDVVIGEYFMKYSDEAPTALTGAWPNFRGGAHNNIEESPEAIQASDEEYPILWSFDTGEGHAAPVIY